MGVTGNLRTLRNQSGTVGSRTWGSIFASGGGGAGSFFTSPGTAGTGGSGVVVIKQNPVFSASGVWPLSQVYQQTRNSNWGQPT